MKYPPEHYPNSGIQHTRAVVALTVCQAFMDIYHAPPKTPIATHMRKIATSIESCSIKTKKRKLSAGARRAMDWGCESLAPYIEDSPLLTDGERFRRWAALVWCGLTFIDDVLATCPDYRTKEELPRWRTLRKKVETLCDALALLEPGFDEAGTMLYEIVAWALEGVDFPADDRLAA